MRQGLDRPILSAIFWLVIVASLATAILPDAFASRLTAADIQFTQTSIQPSAETASFHLSALSMRSALDVAHVGSGGHADHDEGQAEHCGPECNTAADVDLLTYSHRDMPHSPQGRCVSIIPNFPELDKTPPKPNAS